MTDYVLYDQAQEEAFARPSDNPIWRLRRRCSGSLDGTTWLMGMYAAVSGPLNRESNAGCMVVHVMASGNTRALPVQHIHIRDAG